MKKFRLLAVITALAMLMPSCDLLNSGDEPGDGKVQFKASTEAQVRTTLGDNYEVLWSQGDKIVVLGITNENDLQVNEFTLTSGAGTTEGVFEGELQKEHSAYYALYPSSIYQGANAEGFYLITLPTNAIFAEKNFVDGANPMLAYGTKEDGLQFRNICGIIEFQIKGEGTVSHIQIESNNQLLSGTVAVSPVDLRFYNAGGDMYAVISATLKEPLVLSPNEAKSIYAIVPPMTYNGLTIKTIDVNGVVTSRTTTDNIVVERSKITPVSSFEHSDVAEAPAVRLNYREENSDFALTRLDMILNASAAGAYYTITNEERYNAAVAEGKSDAEIAKGGVTITNSITNGSLNNRNYVGSKIHVVAIAYDVDGNFNEYAEHLVITPKTDVPEDNTYSGSIVAESEGSMPNSKMFSISTTIPSGMIAYVLCTEEQYAELTDLQKRIYSAVGYTGSQNFNDSFAQITLFDLVPGESYKLLYRVAGGEMTANNTYTGYSPVIEHTFTIPEYNTSDITVNISMSEVEDWSAVLNISSTGASKYKILCTTSTFKEGEEYLIESYGEEFEGSVTSHKYTNLNELTTYNIYAIAYDAEGVYGKMASLSFTTLSLTPAPSAEYDKFLGDYIFSSKKGCYNNDERPVTITKGVDGKTLYVKGLMNPVAKENFGITDDTMVAKFDASTNAISLGGQIADQGNLPYPIYTCLYSGYYILQNARLSATYNNGELVFVYSYADVGFTGLVFYSSVDGYQGSAGTTNCDYYTDLVLRKAGQGGSSNANTTEGFGRNDETNVNWQ